MHFPERGLYAITDDSRAGLVSRCEAVLRGGAAVLQYRDKSADHARRRADAAALVALCARFRVPLIVNDDVELAAHTGAAGVHLGEHDTDIGSARRRLGPRAVIGVSCYDSLQRARELADAGADYLAFGAFHPSPTKPLARRATADLLLAARAFGKPLVAIGGITLDNARPLLDAGADFLAVISGVFASSDPEAAAGRYVKLFE